MAQGSKGTAKPRITNTTEKIRIWISVDKPLYDKLNASRIQNERTMTGEIVAILKAKLK